MLTQLSASFYFFPSHMVAGELTKQTKAAQANIFFERKKKNEGLRQVRGV